jgi:hypothetical protein
MTRSVGGETPVRVQKYLKGIDYPAKKEDLIATAKSNKAPEEIVNILQRLPGDGYDGPDDVMRAYGQLK